MHKNSDKIYVLLLSLLKFQVYGAILGGEYRNLLNHTFLVSEMPSTHPQVLLR
jgi:hypothetical protein